VKVVSKPLVSVLIPAYQSERYVGEAIESALLQTHRPIEVIVVDDGSSDGTLAVARRYEAAHPGTVRVIAQANGGACAARNHAFRESRGAYVKFLDADDALAPHALEEELAALEGESGDVIPFGRLIRCDEDLRPKAGAKEGGSSFEYIASASSKAERVAWLLEHNLQTAQPLHPRDWVEQVGGFNEQLLRAQEYELHLRLALAGARFKPVASSGVLVRDHASPHRITNKGRALRAEMPRERVHPQTNRLLEAIFGPEFPAPVRDARARAAWRALRSRAQSGDLEGAREKAVEGQRLDPHFHQVRGRPLSWAYRLLGPLIAERAVALGKRMTGRSGALGTPFPLRGAGNDRL
jgi:GT2 family glycosyltransferase